MREPTDASGGARHIWLFAAAVVAVRLLFAFFLHINSDEPQHLHVAWAWSRGLVQYRDVFDNHFPLLHLLFAPLMAIVPESSSVIVLMRLALLPFVLGAAWLLYRVGRPLLGTSAAAIAALLFTVLPPWLPKSAEFRNDTLWIFLWLAALALLIGRQRPAYLAAGVAAALCLLASVKLVPILLAHALALASERRMVAPKMVMRFAAGAAIPFAAISTFMYALGAFDEMIYATLLYNGSLPVDPGRRIAGLVSFAILAPLLALRGPRALTALDPVARHLALFAAWFVLVLLCFWPIITPRDFLPLVPLGALGIAALRIARAAPALVLVLGTRAGATAAELWEPPDLSRQRFVDAAVRLTRPDEYVFDLKGNAIFRRRPVRFIYDAVGRALIANGTLPDDAPERIIASGTCVAMEDMTHIPSRTRAFLNAHFVDIGPLRVCGTVARGGAFTIAVPQTYAAIARDPSRVTIDGVPYRGPRFLTAGRHTVTSAGDEPVTVIWSRAAKERG
ncbi:MAG TPA: glycosyltransferase family 39 protein [Thermoanaerobaculia bacterium]|nr:glycosyltransferase family 39 protein [Thermoanaerobaculia bacterium]